MPQKDIKFIEFGEYNFSISIIPVSCQSSRSNIKNFQSSINDKIKDCPNIFVGEIGISIEWHTSHESRYMTSQSCDIDNIIKPIIDSMTGFNGLFVDDCQVQTVTCSWIDKNLEINDFLYINVYSLERNNDLVFNKRNIVFFQWYDKIYYLINNNNKIVVESIVNICNKILELNNLYDLNINELSSKIWPLGAVKFHYDRIKKAGFPLIKVEEIKEYINSLI